MEELIFNEQEKTEQINDRRSDSGGIWFICFLPLLGLFLQNFVISAVSGAFLWAAVAVLEVLGCVLDYRSISRQELYAEKVSGLIRWAWISPVYVYRREKALGKEVYKAFMLGAFIFAAVTLNGFTAGLRYNTDNMPELIKSTAVQSLDNFSGSIPSMIGDVTESYLGEDARWQCTKKGKTFTVTCKGDHEGSEVEIEFKVVHDGFVFESFKVSSIKADGKKLKGDDYEQVMKEIFIPETLTDDSSSNAE